MSQTFYRMFFNFSDFLPLKYYSVHYLSVFVFFQSKKESVHYICVNTVIQFEKHTELWPATIEMNEATVKCIKIIGSYHPHSWKKKKKKKYLMLRRKL